jgi:hypothetical protein
LTNTWCGCPLDVLGVPAGEGLPIDLHDQVLFEAGVVPADLRIPMLPEHPALPGLGGLIGELEADDHPIIGKSFAFETDGAPGPQH